MRVLDWEHRKQLLLAEINSHTPDILCLQELQGNAAGAGPDDHYSWLAEHMRVQGYEGRYVRKTKRNGIGWPNAQIGNAIFWRENTFAYLEHVDVPIAVHLNAACADEPSRAHFGRGAQVGLCVALKHIRSGQEVIAVTTHLSCNFQEPWTQVAQVRTVLAAAATLQRKYGVHTPVVLGADLNSIPGSGVYHLVASGHLPASHPHLKIIAEHVEFPEFDDSGGSGGGGGGVTQPIDFGGKSAYAALLGQEPLFTNFTPGFIGCLDYIFSSTGLTPLQVLVLPIEDQVRLEGYLPASMYPSDHVSLFARFAINTPAAIAATSLSPPMNRTSVAAPAPMTVLPPSQMAADAASDATLMPPPAWGKNSALPAHLRPASGPGAEPSPSKRCRCSSTDNSFASSAAAGLSVASSAASSVVSSAVSSPREGAPDVSDDAAASVAALDAVHLSSQREGRSAGGSSGSGNRSDSHGSSHSPQEGWRDGGQHRGSRHQGPSRGGGRGGGGGGGGSRRSSRRQ